MTWARLLKRVFDIDIEHCACGGELKLIAVIEEPVVIEKILKHIGLDPQPPPREKARRVELFEVASRAESDGDYRDRGGGLSYLNVVVK